MRILLSVLFSLFPLRLSSVQFKTFSSSSRRQAAVVGIGIFRRMYNLFALPWPKRFFLFYFFLRTSKKRRRDRNQDVKLDSNPCSLPLVLYLQIICTTCLLVIANQKLCPLPSLRIIRGQTSRLCLRVTAWVIWGKGLYI